MGEKALMKEIPWEKKRNVFSSDMMKVKVMVRKQMKYFIPLCNVKSGVRWSPAHVLMGGDKGKESCPEPSKRISG